MRFSSNRPEVECPVCGAAFAVSPGERRKKVQCPRCRCVVTVKPERAPDGSGAPTVAEFAELKAKVERLEVLSERFDALERAMSQLRPVDLPPEDNALELEPPVMPRMAPPLPDPPAHQPPIREEPPAPPRADVRWVEPIGAGDDTGSPVQGVEARQEEVLLHNLRALGPRDIAMHVAVDAPTAHHLSVPLADIFRRAGWTVQGPQPVLLPERDCGLTLATGPSRFPEEGSATYMALMSAGLPVALRLDDTLAPREAILIVGAGVGRLN